MTLAAFEHLDHPKDLGGMALLCGCSDADRAPTHRLIEKTEVTYWCKRCGLQLPMRVMDAYFMTDDYKIEAEFQDERQNQKLWAAREGRRRP